LLGRQTGSKRRKADSQRLQREEVDERYLFTDKGGSRAQPIGDAGHVPHIAHERANDPMEEVGPALRIEGTGVESG
jgi:hypothetical protein